VAKTASPATGTLGQLHQPNEWLGQLHQLQEQLDSSPDTELLKQFNSYRNSWDIPRAIETAPNSRDSSTATEMAVTASPAIGQLRQLQHTAGTGPTATGMAGTASPAIGQLRQLQHTAGTGPAATGMAVTETAPLGKGKFYRQEATSNPKCLIPV
jgi:hypothetical protein